MLECSRLYKSEGSNAINPVVLEPIIMSIVFEHYKQLEKLEPLIEKESLGHLNL